MAFIETPRFPDTVFRGAVRSQRFSTDITVYGSGYESRNKNWLYPLHSFQIPWKHDSATIRVIQNWHKAAFGAGDGFRAKDLDDYKSTDAMSTAIANTDQVLGTGDGTTAVFQLYKSYTIGANTLTRKITKPVTGTTIIAIAGVSDTNWSIDTTTGAITFVDTSASITNITQAAQAVVTENAHSRSTNDTVHLSGVVGMTEINGLRGTIQSTTTNTYTLDIDSSGFTAYASAGTANSLPQSGESVTAGYEFDVPVRFESDQLDTILPGQDVREISDLVLVEIR